MKPLDTQAKNFVCWNDQSLDPPPPPPPCQWLSETSISPVRQKQCCQAIQVCEQSCLASHSSVFSLRFSHEYYSSQTSSALQLLSVYITMVIHGTYCTACHCVGADVLPVLLSLFLLVSSSCSLFGPSWHLCCCFFFLSRYLQSLHCHRTPPSKKKTTHNANVTCQINGKVGFSALYSVLAEALADWSRAAPANSSAP